MELQCLILSHIAILSFYLLQYFEDRAVQYLKEVADTPVDEVCATHLEQYQHSVEIYSAAANYLGVGLA